ncbi:DUF4817 domain-containing protein [Trichonephila clavipes]|nr:DUF4817 domain-containing protein [Trichonephila clavipes]
MMFFQEQRIVFDELYFAIKSHCRVINAFQQKYPRETVPNLSKITVLVQRFRDTVLVADRKRSDRASKVKMKVTDVETALQSSPLKRPSHLHEHHYVIHILAESDEIGAWLQQEGATCHTLWDSSEVLTEFFDYCVISKGLCPPRLPDLFIQDFF